MSKYHVFKLKQEMLFVLGLLVVQGYYYSQKKMNVSP